MKFVAAYIAVLGTIFIVDMIWLGLVATSFYKEQLGALMTDNINWLAAIVFYALYAVGIIVFAISPALESGAGWQRAAVLGAFLGFIAYATYDLTNLATLRGFPMKLAIVDMAWGTVLTALTATAGYLAAAKFG